MCDKEIYRVYEKSVDCSNLERRKTTVGRFWADMRDRCIIGGRVQRLNPTYIGCEMSANFKDIQFFGEWCEVQVGFGERDASGKHWGLDKDLLKKGNKLYSEDLCVFLPHEINCFMTKRKARRGILPIGVSFKTKNGNYTATICIQGKSKHLCSTSSVEQAFAAYKIAKESYAKELAAKWQDKIDPRAYEALMNYQVEITD